MRTTDQGRIFCKPHRALETAGDPRLFKRFTHTPGTLDAAGTDRLKSGIELRVSGIEVIAKHMHLQTAPFDRNLHAGNELHANLIGHDACGRQPTKIVVISQ